MGRQSFEDILVSALLRQKSTNSIIKDYLDGLKAHVMEKITF